MSIEGDELESFGFLSTIEFTLENDENLDTSAPFFAPDELMASFYGEGWNDGNDIGYGYITNPWGPDEYGQVDFSSGAGELSFFILGIADGDYNAPFYSGSCQD